MQHSNKYRSSLCAEISSLEEVKVCGWLSKKRDHGKVIFFEIRDTSGILQVVIEEDDYISKETLESIAKTPLESVIKITGTVIERDESQKNHSIPTGQVELRARTIEVLSRSVNLPFSVDSPVSEELCYENRPLYLRSSKMQKALKLRSKVIKAIMDFMYEKNFTYIQTPILGANSPEGARNFVVPSRLHKGKFYALPQSPQIYKQLLMISGFDRYFQIAPCFRDEDARADRCSGEFYQLDFEMSFVEEKHITDFTFEVTEHLLQNFDHKPIRKTTISYEKAQELYGTDKPDMRNPLILEDFTHIFSSCGMDIFEKAIKDGAIVKGIRIQNSLFNKTDFEKTLAFCQTHGFRTAYIEKLAGQIKGPVSKFLDKIIISENEAIFFVCSEKKKCLAHSSLLRTYLGEKTGCIKEEHHLVLVKDFPMFEEEDGKWSFFHNPFSKPQNLIGNENNLSIVKAFQFDLVLNGYELFSGSVRNDSLEQLEKVFLLLGYKKEEFEERFKCMKVAFEMGVPPHGGAAMGLDRLLMIILEEHSVREVCAFPLNTKGYDSLTGAPNEVDEKILKMLNIVVKKSI